MANEVLTAIRARRSIRRFKPQQVKPEELDAVLEAGLYAPSGGGRQTVYLVSVQQPALREKISKLNAAVLDTSGDPYYGAPTVVLALASKDSEAWVEDAGAALENVLLAACSLGLGACWIHRERQMFESAEGKALLKEWGLPENVAGVGGVALGYAEGEAPAAAPRKPGRIVKR